jgi:hypothetical protein
LDKKDIHTLTELARKLGESICDAGTFEERQTKFLIMKWRYKGSEFLHKFPGSNKTVFINHQFSHMRKDLRACGLKPPREFSEGFSGSKQQQILLEEIWIYLGTDDEGETPYGGDVGK